MRGNDLLLAFPALLLAIMFGAVFGGSTLVAMVAIGVASVPSFARLVRSGAMQVMGTEYVLAARAAGRGPWAIGASARPAQRRRPGHRAGLGLLRHRRPRRGGPVLPRLRHPAAHADVGPDAPGEPGAALLRRHASPFIPGLAIALAVLGFNLLGDGLRDHYDPRMDDRR